MGSNALSEPLSAALRGVKVCGSAHVGWGLHGAKSRDKHDVGIKAQFYVGAARVRLSGQTDETIQRHGGRLGIA